MEMGTSISNVEKGNNHKSQIILSSRLQAHLTKASTTPGVHSPTSCILKPLISRKDDLRTYNTRHYPPPASKCQSKSLLRSIFTFRRKLMKYEAAVEGMGIRQTLMMLENSSHKQSRYQDRTTPWQTSFEIFGMVITTTRSKDVLAIKKAEIAKNREIKERDQKSQAKQTALENLEHRLQTQEKTLQASESKLNRREIHLTHREQALAQGQQNLSARKRDLAQRERDIAYWEQAQAPLRRELNNRERRLESREQSVSAREQAIGYQEDLQEREQNVTQREQNLQRSEWKQEKRKVKLRKWEKRLARWEQDLVAMEGQVRGRQGVEVYELDGEGIGKVKVD